MTFKQFQYKFHYFLHHGLSRLVAKLANCNVVWLKNSLIKIFIAHYKIDLNIAARKKVSDYHSFNDFFTRTLNLDARPLATSPTGLISPVDGIVTQLGDIVNGQLIQAKNHHFQLDDLLAQNSEQCVAYSQGQFMTIYLAPKDYHRVHMPITGRLLRTCYVPGQLFSVNHRSVATVPNLFSRNERLVCFFDTEIGEIAIIMVAAMLVAGIVTVWSGQETPCHSSLMTTKDYSDHKITLTKGSEMAHFEFGSTVILLFRPKTVELLPYQAIPTVKMGQQIGHLLVNRDPL